MKRLILPTVLLALTSLGLSACEDDGAAAPATDTAGGDTQPDAETPGDPVATVNIHEAVVTRCNQMMQFRSVLLQATVANAGASPLTLGDLTLVADDAALLAGTAEGPDAVVVAPGESVRLSCIDRESVLAWPAADDTSEHSLTVSVAFTDGAGASAGEAEGSGPLSFIEAWDSCDTSSPKPRPCVVVSAEQ